MKEGQNLVKDNTVASSFKAGLMKKFPIFQKIKEKIVHIRKGPVSKLANKKDLADDQSYSTC